MTQPRPTVAEVIRSVCDRYLGYHGTRLTPEQRRVLKDLPACRTAALGGHVLECQACGHQQIAYNSCGNRHCPTCQATAAARWLERCAAELLPVPYFHLVFTLPDALGQIALRNPRVVYNLLFQAAAAGVQELAADPDHLGARTGMLVVLHTWGQTLQFHPHLHCVVPGGGLSLDGKSWVPSHSRFFLPVRALSRLFRGKFLSGLRSAYTRGRLCLPGVCPEQEAAAFERLVSVAARTDWVVYAKPPFGGPERVLKYLAQYTHRVAISNRRLLSLKEGVVRFRYKDYAHGNRKRVMQLSAPEFVRRFLLHVLPKGFVRIRRYGFLSNRNQQDLELCQDLLSCSSSDETKPAKPEELPKATKPLTPTRVCPHCGADRMVIISEFPPLAWSETVPVRAFACAGIDSS